MKKFSTALFSSNDLDRFMETGVTSIRRSLKRTSDYTRKLQHMPVNLFAAVMGIAGLALAWRQAVSLFGISPLISGYIGLLAIIVFAVISIFYLAKFILFPKKVKEEFLNPVIGNFFGTIPISILLLSAVIRFYRRDLGETLWVFGLILGIVLTYVLVDRLIKNKQDLLHATPAWLIPGVGTLDIAVTGSGIEFPWSMEVNLLAFAIGSILALVFFTLIFSRLMHHEPMPERLLPSLIILIAPFEVGFLAYINLTGSIDMFASILFYFGLFLFTILFFKVFNRKLPFMISWWAVGFPIAALSNASLKYAIHSNTLLLKSVALVLLLILSVLIAVIFVRTIILILQRRLLQG